MKIKLYSLVMFLMFTVSAFAFPIPDTGITKCYDDTKEIPCPTAGQDFYGQDGNYSINPMSYTKLDSTGVALPVTATDWAMVRDNVTGLIWENNSHPSTWYNAPTVIASLNTAKFGGYSDWRMPTLLELFTIIDYSVSSPTIDTSYFKDTFNYLYWSSTTHPYSTNYARGVYFYDGYYYNPYKGYRNYVRAVRGGQSDIGLFDTLVINGDGTATDTGTGLMWQQDTAKTATGATTMVWKDALSYCENLNLGGYTDWRLPTVRELLSIVDYTVYSPAIDTSVFKYTLSSYYWSSSTRYYDIGNALGVLFYVGSEYYYSKYHYYYVRAVRAGQSVIGTKPTATTSPATSITSNSATLNGTVNPNSSATTYYFEYGLTTSYGSKTTSQNAGSGSTDSAVTADITGLAYSTTYHFRLVAANSAGTTNGNDQTFTTLGIPPTVTTGAATAASITEAAAALNGTVNPNKSAATYYFEYGTSTSYGSKTTSQNAGSGSTDSAVAADITGLTYSTTYHFRLVATNSVGTTNGNDQTFTTLGIPPTVTTGAATAASITEAAATLNGTVNPNKSAATYYFEYGTTTSYGSKTTSQSAGSGSTASAVAADITGLAYSTTYHFRLVAANSAGTTNGNDQTFTTLAKLIPNLTITSLSVPPSLQILTQSTISWNVKNSGQKDAAGSWIDQFYLSVDDTLGSDDTLLGEFTKTGGLAVNSAYQRTETVNIPKVEPDSYYIILKTDRNGTLEESDETDNIYVQPVTLTNAKLMTITPDRIELSIVAGNTQTGNLQIGNISTVDMSGITAAVKNAPSNITVQITPPTLLKSLTSQTITYTVKAVDDSVSTGEVTVLFEDSQGNEASVLFVIKVLPGTPKLATNPGYLESGMLRGKQRSVEFELSNIGGASANSLKIAIPQASWLKLVTPENIGSLAAGAKTNVVLMLKPSNDMTLGPYTGELVVSGSNANLRVGFKFTAVSDAKGSLKVIAEDEFTYFAEDKPNVSGAEVLVKDAFDNSKIIAQGTTDETGIFTASDINEGRYDIEVRAEKHSSYHSTIEIVSGSTKEVKAFMSRQFVSYKWTVEPTEIQDDYKVVLEAEFETHVPAPVVTVEPKTQVVPVIEGETAAFNLTVTNHGLIAAQGVTLNFADSDKYEVVPFIKDIGLLPAMSSVVVPVNIRAKSAAIARLKAEKAGTRTSSGNELCDFLNGEAVVFYYCGEGRVWKNASFSIKPILFIFDVIDALGCASGDITGCISLGCSAAGISPCACMLVGMNAPGIGNLISAAQCAACSVSSGGGGSIVDYPSTGVGIGTGSNDWPTGGIGIARPADLENLISCDPSTRPKNKSDKTEIQSVSSDIIRYGGKIVRYKVTGK